MAHACTTAPSTPSAWGVGEASGLTLAPGRLDRIRQREQLDGATTPGAAAA